jgi:hypothetical protein
MVCQKTPESAHDFAKDPIRLVERDGWIYGDGTTLGADNGIGVAMAMAAATEPKLNIRTGTAVYRGRGNGTIEGHMALRGFLRSRRLLNLDAKKMTALRWAARRGRADADQTAGRDEYDGRMECVSVDGGRPAGRTQWGQYPPATGQCPRCWGGAWPNWPRRGNRIGGVVGAAHNAIRRCSGVGMAAGQANRCAEITGNTGEFVS